MPYEDFAADYNDNSGAELDAVGGTLTWTVYERQDAGYFDKDFGANYFDDFTFWFDVVFSDVDAGDADVRAMMKTLICVTDNLPLTNDYLRVFPLQDGGNDDKVVFRMNQVTGGLLDFSVTSGILNMDTFYCVLKRSGGTTIEFDAYSTEALRKAGAGGDLANLDDGGNGNTNDYRYLYVCEGNNSGVDPNDDSTGTMSNVCLTGGACAATGTGWVTKGGWW